MTTHSLPSQPFRAPAPSLRAMVRRLLAAWSGTSRTPKIGAERIEQANQLRDYAASVRSHDPRFATDLFAAADRHERHAE